MENNPREVEMVGIRIRMLNVIKLWRFKFYWCRGYFAIYWLTDWAYLPNRRTFDWNTELPLIRRGDTW